MKLQRSLLIAGLIYLSPVDAYEITTHALITDHAYKASVLNPANPKSIVPILGLDRLDDDYPFAYPGGALATDYRDEVALINPADTEPSVNGNYVRAIQTQERHVFQALVSRGYLNGPTHIFENRVRAWLTRGVIREDDNDIFKFGGWHTADKRDLDPFGRLLRAGGHFYDPIHDRGMDTLAQCVTYVCVRSIKGTSKNLLRCRSFVAVAPTEVSRA